MKHFKLLLASALTLFVALLIATPALAQEVDTQKDGDGSVSVSNPAGGETYGVYKVFEASYAANQQGNVTSVIYKFTGDVNAFNKDNDSQDQAGVKTSLKDVFELNTTTGVVTKKAGVSEKAVTDAVRDYVYANKAALEQVTPVVSDGTAPLTFKNLPYGYYLVTSTQGNAAVSIDSNLPDATVRDKNDTTPQLFKTVEKQSYTVGSTIKYTGTFNTANRKVDQQGEDRIIVSYTINDTLPDFLDNVEVTDLYVTDSTGQTKLADIVDTNGDPLQFANKEIVIPWVEQDNTTGSWKIPLTSLYPNGARIIIKYQGTLTKDVKVDGNLVNDGNINTLTVTPKDETGRNPWDEPFRSQAKIFTYGAAFKKVDDNTQNPKPLAGAKFAVNGLTLTQVAPGVYWVVNYDATSTTLGTEMVSPTDGCIYILGLEQGVTLPVVETAAPVGYNKLNTPFNVPSKVMGQEIWESTGTRYFDADGNLVAVQSTADHFDTRTSNLALLDPAEFSLVNQSGTELPSTGGMGTTIFYVVGSALVVCAGVLLVTKRRVAKTEA